MQQPAGARHCAHRRGGRSSRHDRIDPVQRRKHPLPQTEVRMEDPHRVPLSRTAHQRSSLIACQRPERSGTSVLVRSTDYVGESLCEGTLRRERTGVQAVDDAFSRRYCHLAVGLGNSNDS